MGPDMNLCNWRVGVRFFRQTNLFGQREEINQHETRELVSLFRLFKRNPIYVMQRFISKNPQLMRPLLKGWGYQVLFSELFNSVPKIVISKVWSNQFSTDFKCPSIHGCCGLGIVAKNILFGLNKRFGYIWAAMFRTTSDCTFWNHLYRFYICGIAQISGNTFDGVSSCFNKCHNCSATSVANKHRIESVLSEQSGRPTYNKIKADMIGSAIRTVMDENRHE